MFSLVPVRDHRVKQLACGESHTIISSLKSGDSSYTIKSAGSNDKYQLGISGVKRDHL